MRKYIEVAKIMFKVQITYRFDVAMTVLFTIAKILFAYILWGAIFSDNETVSGFTFNSMLSYYIISSFLSQIDQSDGVSGEISDRIRGGTFSKYMVVPVSVGKYFTAQTIGSMSFYLVFILTSTILWVLIFNADFVITSNILVIFQSALLIILGLLFMIQLNIFLGMLAFKFQDIWMFLMIKNNFVEIITGSFVPLALFPEQIVFAMRFFPFYYITYLPSMMLIGKNQDEAIIGLITLSAWLFSFILLNKFSYNKLRIIYDGVGI